VNSVNKMIVAIVQFASSRCKNVIRVYVSSVSVPEVSSKRIIYMTLEAVSFCHSHNVLIFCFSYCLQFFCQIYDHSLLVLSYICVASLQTDYTVTRYEV